MKIGRFAFLSLRPAWFYSPGNGRDRQLTPKTLSRKRSSSSGGGNHDIANRGLLYATVRSIALDFIRRDSRRARREATAFSDADQSVQPEFEIEDDSQRALVAALDRLPAEQREVLVMKIWNDLTFAEIASALGISQNTAASRYRYALAALKKNLSATMNDFSELEDQLRKLRPAQPSADLVTRIEHALAERDPTPTAGMLPRQRRFHFNWLSLGLGLAAAAALVMFALSDVEQPAKKTSSNRIDRFGPAGNSTNPSGQFVPAGLTQVVYHTRDEGLHFPSNSEQPMRRVRSQTRETLQWRNPKTGASLRISYPSEEVSLLPVSGHEFATRKL